MLNRAKLLCLPICYWPFFEDLQVELLSPCCDTVSLHPSHRQYHLQLTSRIYAPCCKAPGIRSNTIINKSHMWCDQVWTQINENQVLYFIVKFLSRATFFAENHIEIELTVPEMAIFMLLRIQYDTKEIEGYYWLYLEININSFCSITSHIIPKRKRNVSKDLSAGYHFCGWALFQTDITAQH